MHLVPPTYSGNLVFRRAIDTEEEAAAVVALVQSAYRGQPSRAGWTTEADLVAGQRTDIAQVHAALAGEPQDSTLLLAAEPGGQLIGCCQVQRRIEPPAQDVEPAARGIEPPAREAQEEERESAAGVNGPCGAYFGLFAVSPTRQSAGIGGALLALAEQHAVTHWQAGWMELVVIAQRAELIAWYQRRGYRQTGQNRPFPYDDPRLGQPMRPDLYFAVLRRSLA